jgi:Bifunctional DNA primase/polymerase, N-terminal
MTTIEIARNYLRRQWVPIPIPIGCKQPLRDAWQMLRPTNKEMPTYFGQPSNIGVLLEMPSGWLIDVDLDHPFALEVAGTYLPRTDSIFGRDSKRRSHWLYYTARPVSTKQWRLPDRQMVVELRSTGAQTVFPGSVHESGELIEWDSDGEPAAVDPDDLQQQLQAINEEVLLRLGLPPTNTPRPRQINGRFAPASVLSRSRKYLAKLPPAVSGQGGHNATFNVACVLILGFGLDREDSLALIREWNETCQPVWTERDLEHKVDDALKQPGWRGHLLAGTQRTLLAPCSRAIERANRHAMAHRRRSRRKARA